MEIIIDHTNLYYDPLLGNELVNTFPQHTHATIEGHPLLGNRPVNLHP
jgi:hypothetical protein